MTCVVASGTAGTDITNFAAVSASDQADAVTGNNSDTAVITPLPLLTAGTVQFWAGTGEAGIMLPGAAERTRVLSLVLTNQGADPDTMTGLTVTDLAVGPGNQAELDGQWQPLELGVRNRRLGGELVTVASASFSAGAAVFGGLDWALQPGDTLDIAVFGAPSLAARDNAQLRLGLASAAAIEVTQPLSAPDTWPMVDGSVVIVDGFSAAQAAVLPVDARLFPVGSRDNLALAVDLPGNGYLDDRLNGLSVANHGSAEPDRDLAGMHAWADDGDGSFDPAGDLLLGPLAFSGDLWQITGLDTPVPATGRRFFITVDIAETASPSSDIRLGLPGGSNAVQMASGNDGPRDGSLDNPGTQGISVTDRVIMTADFINSGAIHPDAGGLNLLQFVLTNTYTTARTLQGLTVSNTASGPGGQDRLDGIARQVTLRRDGNGNGILDDPVTDPQLASGTFTAGNVTFPGLDISLAPGASERLFVVADLDPGVVADGDVIGAQITGVFGIDMPDATVVAGWPLDSGAAWVADGMIADQIATGPVRTMTLGPDDGPVLALDLTVPGNGGLGDRLQGVTVTNLGSADGSDVTARLWADGGDGEFGSGAGDDILLGPLAVAGSSWTSTVLDRVIPSQGLRLFVGVDVASVPRDSVTVELSVPVNGLVVASDNDGPLDRTVPAGGMLIITTSPLRTSLAFDSGISNVGQTGSLTMTITNAGAETLSAVTPTVSIDSGAGLMVLGEPAPASLASLAPGQTAAITWPYTGQAPGTVVIVGNAEGSTAGAQVRRSIATPSSPHRIFNPVGHLELYPTINLPFSVNRGQAGLVPLTLTFMNPGDAETANAHLTGFSLRFAETEGGSVISPTALLDRITVSEGTEIYLDRTDLPDVAGPLDLVFDRPVQITSEEPVTLGVRLDLDLNSTAPSFQISIEDATWFNGKDAVDNHEVPVLMGQGAYPLQTGQAILVSPAAGLDIAVVTHQVTYAEPGQRDVPLLTFQAANNSGDDASTIEVGQVSFSLHDSSGAVITLPDSLLEWLTLKDALGEYFSGSAATVGDTLLVLPLSPPLTVPGNATRELTILGDIAPTAPLGHLVAHLAAPEGLDARDGNMNNPVPVTLATAAVGDPVVLVSPATTLQVSGSGTLAPTLARGSRDVQTMSLLLSNPHAAGSAALVCDGLVLEFLDGEHNPLDPDLILDRIRVQRGASFPGVVIEPGAADGVIPVPLEPISLEPGALPVSLEILLDIKTDAPSLAMEVVLGEEGISAHDAVSGAPASAALPGGGQVYINSGTTNIVQPADELLVAYTDLIPALLPRDGSFVPAMSLSLANPSASGFGAIELSALNIHLSPPDAGQGAKDMLAGGVAVQALRLMSGEDLVAEAADIAPDAESVTLVPTSSPEIPAGGSRAVTIAVQIRDTAPSGQFRLYVDVGDIVANQAGSANTPVHVGAASGVAFPFSTRVGNISELDLSSSFINFPNPFAAGNEATTFAYNLPAAGRVSLRILTPHGRVVSVLLTDEPKSAGLHQDDIWQGVNGRGQPVRNGVYLAELRVVYDDGSGARALRKVGVVR